MEQSRGQGQIEPSEVLILKYGGLISLMCFSSLNLQPKCLKKNRIDGKKVKNYMIPRSSHGNEKCMVLISPDHPYHHHYRYLHLHFLLRLLLHLPRQHIHCHILCALRNLFSVKPFNVTINQFKPIMKLSIVG